MEVVAGAVLGEAKGGSNKHATLITDRLTQRETEVLRLLARGLTNEDISRQLFLSEGTVRNHVSSIVSKLGLVDRTQAAAYAWQEGIIHREG